MTTTTDKNAADTSRCAFPDCGRRHVARGYCSTHYGQLQAGQDLRPIRPRNRGCSIDGCTEKHHAHGLCHRHYVQDRVEAARAARPPKTPRLPEPCAVDYCPNDAKTAGYCAKHDTNLRKHGTPEAPNSRPTKGAGGDPVEFVKGKITVTEGGCWEVPTWGGRYRCMYYGGERWQAHRWAWVHLAGLPLKRWPEEQLDHICGNTACIRPAHLQKVTQAENNRLRDKRLELLAGAEPDEYLAAPNKPRTLLEWEATVRLSPELLEREGWQLPQDFRLIHR